MKVQNFKIFMILISFDLKKLPQGGGLEANQNQLGAWGFVFRAMSQKVRASYVKAGFKW